MENHKHKMVRSKQKEKGFSGCVAPYACNPSSHGNITIIDTCSCGATRRTNINQNHQERGAWVEPEDK